MPRSHRSQSRALALQALCALDALGEPLLDELDALWSDPANCEDLGWDAPPPNDVLRFARELVTGTWQRRERCDELLRTHVPKWTIERMQPVDRNILRLGVYELLHCPETPPTVVINEAVGLAQHFGGNDSPAFVNGVLDAVRRVLATDGSPADDATAPPAAQEQHEEPHGSV